MSLELLNTLGTLTTVVIVAAAAVAALIQLRHLRAGNQINALLTVGEAFSTPSFRDAMHLVNFKLAVMLEDPLFRDYAVSIACDLPPPDVRPGYIEVRRAAIAIASVYEDLGILIKHHVVDRAIFLDRYSSTIVSMWCLLAPFLAFIRAVKRDPAVFENFEFLVVSSQDWEREHPVSYPLGVRRLQLTNPWPIAAPATS